MLILSSYFVSGAFSQSGVAGNYSIGEEVTATITCAPADKGDEGHYAWYANDGTLLENDTLTCPQKTPYIMFASWTVTSAQAPQEGLQGNLTEEGVFISGAFFNTTLTGGTHSIDFTDVTTTTDIYEGKYFVKGRLKTRKIKEKIKTNARKFKENTKSALNTINKL